MFFIGLRQQSSLPHYRSRRKSHLMTLWEITQELGLIFLANQDLALCSALGAAAVTSLFGIMTMAVSVVVISIATTVSSTATVSSPISDSSGLATLTIGIATTTDTRTTSDTP